MNIRRITARTAVAGVTAALAAGALVGVSTTAANAASASGDYTCTAMGNPLGAIPVTLEVPVLPPTAVAGFEIPGGLLNYTSTVTIPAAFAPTFQGLGIDSGHADDFTLTVGDETVVEGPGVYTPRAETEEDGTLVLDGTGSNLAFSLPKAGTYDINLPAAFTMTMMNGETALVDVACTTADPATLGSITLSKQASTVTAKAPKAVKKSQHAMVPVTVKNEYSKATGKVTAMEGKKSVGVATLKNGKAVIKLAKLKPGTHKIVVKYSGDGFTQGGKSVAIKVVVKK